MEAGLWAPTSLLWAGPLLVRIVGRIAVQRSRGSPLSCVIWHNGREIKQKVGPFGTAALQGEISDVTTEGNAPWRTQDGAFLLG